MQAVSQHGSRGAVFRVSEQTLAIARAIDEAGGRPILVGGWVRDSLMGRTQEAPKDYDIEVFALPLERLRKVLKPFGPVHLVGRHFGVLKLHTDEAEYDVSVPRRESNVGKGHKGFLVETDPSMTFAEAAARRDFTINAMGHDPLSGELLDPHGGLGDLEAGVLRHVGPAFGEDPLRVLRAMQFAARFGLRIAPETLAICRQQDLHELPRERLWDEFRKLLLLAARPSAGLELTPELGVLEAFPALRALYEPPAGDSVPGPISQWQETLALLDAAAAHREGDETRDRVLMLAALGWHMLPVVEHSAAPPALLELAARDDTPLAGFLAQLSTETRLLRQVPALVALAHAPHAWRNSGTQTSETLTNGHVRRLAWQLSTRHLDTPLLAALLSTLHEAGIARGSSSGDDPGAWLEQRARALDVWDAPPVALVQGRQLLAAGWQPGPHIGRALEAVFEAQLDGAVADEAAALAAAEDLLRAKGLAPGRRGDSKGGKKEHGGKGGTS